MRGEQRDEGRAVLAENGQQAALVGRQLNGPGEEVAGVIGAELPGPGRAVFVLLGVGIHNLMLGQLIQVV